MKILNAEEIFKNADNPKIAEFIDTLTKPFDIDEKIKLLETIDKTIPLLYLSGKSLKIFDMYESIIRYTVLMMKLFSILLYNKHELIQADSLIKGIIELVPSSKEGFDQFGEKYVYYWSTYFHDGILQALCHEVSGMDDMDRDTESVECLALDSHRAHDNIRLALKKVGLSDTLTKSNNSALASSFAAKKAPE